MSKVIRPAPKESAAEQTKKAHLILKHAHDTARALLHAFDNIRKARGARGGATTDEEQDLLRAMVVFAAAGLDSMLKQLVREALPTIVGRNEAAQAEVETYAARKIRGPAEDPDAIGGTKFLARLLSGASPQSRLVDALVQDLTSGSLQSVEELNRSVKYLGLDPKEVGVGVTDLRPVFLIRNKIIHELDIDFDHPTRNRSIRRRDDMVQHCNSLLEVAQKILRAVDTSVK
ncbi:MAG: hypothetical protein ACE5JJ_06490 [Nitrospinota bacterium]